MSLFQPGQHVELAQYTGDDQIDFYYGVILEVVEYTPIKYHEKPHDFYKPIEYVIPNYNLVAPDGTVISANEHELKPIIRRRNKRPV